MDPDDNALFFDPEHALRCARQRKMIKAWGRAKAPQLCYYTGRTPLPDVLDNLIFVPKADFVSFLTTTRLRLPVEVAFPDPPPPPAVVRAFTKFHQEALATMLQARLERIKTVKAAIAALPPDPPRNGKLRIFAGTSRYTEVIQYSSRGVLDALRELGHEVMLSIEQDDREYLVNDHHTEAILAFRPHLVFTINNHAIDSLPPWTVQAVWWQDPMDKLTKAGTTVAWRPNDLVYTIFGMWFGELLVERGLEPERVRVQHFCIDTNEFRPDPAVVRRPRTITFVGSAYTRDLATLRTTVVAEVRDALRTHLATVGPLTQKGAMEVAARFGLTEEFAVTTIWYTIIRDENIRLLCRIAPGLGWQVEIYGFHWEEDPEVRPYHRGVIRGRDELARLYRSTERALSLQPFMVNHQRLAEIACCGCIPVVYDCRAAADQPHWDDQCAYFNDEASLVAALSRPIDLQPERFMEHFSYHHFAERLLADAAPHLARIGT